MNPKIVAIQRDWEDIFDNSELDSSEFSLNDPSFDYKTRIATGIIAGIPLEKHLDIAKIWLKEAVNGDVLFYPANSEELNFYAIRKSFLVSASVNSSTFMILLAAFLQNTTCEARTTYSSNEIAAAVLTIIACGLIFMDHYVCYRSIHWREPISLTLYQRYCGRFISLQIPNSLRNDHQNLWIIARMISCCLVLLNTLLSLGDHSALNFSKVVIPILFISRRENFRQMFEGLCTAFIKSLRILQLQFFIILVWAFSGWCLFRNYGTNGNDFATFPLSFYTCFHCVLSRPSILFALLNIFDQIPSSTLFFVTLTFFADILCNGFIIAIGTRNFRNFSARHFRARLKYRRIAAQSLFFLYCSNTASGGKEEDEGDRKDRVDKSSAMSSQSPLKMSLQQFITLGKHLGRHNKIDNEHNAELLFQTEDVERTGYVTERQFFRLLGALSVKLKFFNRQELDEEIFVYTHTPETLRNFSVKESLRIIFGFQSSEVTNSDTMASETVVSISGIHDSGDRDVSFVNNPIKPSYKGTSSSPDSGSNSSPNSILGTSALTGKSFQSSSDNDVSEGSTTHHLSERFNVAKAYSDARKAHLQRSYGIKQVITELKRLSVFLCWYEFSFSLGTYSAYIPFYPKFPGSEIIHLNILSCCTVLLYIFLIIQLSFLTNPTTSVGIIALGWLLLFGFFFVNGLQMMSTTHNKLSNRIDLFINVFIFIALSVLGGDPSRISTTTLTIVILSQSLRFIRFFEVVRGMTIFTAILPIVVRAAIFLFLLIFSFSIVGHITLCGRLQPENIPSNNIDTATVWLSFSNILNFDSIFSSLYTVAQVAVISNWTIIMDAAVLSFPEYSWYIYIYFFSYRIAIALVIFPLLLSFIIQSFIQQLNRSYVKSGGDDTRKGREEEIMYSITSKHDLKSPRVMISLWSATGSETVKRSVRSKDEDETLFYLQSLTSDFTYQIKQMMNLYYALSSSRRGTDSNTKATEKLNRNKKISFKPDRYVHYQVAEGFIIHIQNEWLSLLRNNLKKFNIIDFYGTSASEATDEAKHPSTSTSAPSTTLNNYQHLFSEIIQVKAHLPAEDLPRLAAIYFDNAMIGKTIYFPKTSLQVTAMQILYSNYFSTFLSVVVFPQMLSVFLINPECYSHRGNIRSNHSILSVDTFASFNLICVIVYLIDVILDLIVRRDYLVKKRWRGFASWMYLRLICAVWIFIESVLEFNSNSQNGNNHSLEYVKIVRSLFPILVISRATDYQDMLKGLFSTVRQSVLVYNLFFTLLIIYTLLGYFLFHRFETNADRFANYAVSFSTILQCATGAPFALFVVQPYVYINPISQIFFSALSFSTEILCIALVVAVGNAHYRTFNDASLSIRLNKRFYNLYAIWLLLSNVQRVGESAEESEETRETVQSTPQLSYHQWIFFCAQFSGNYTISEEDASDLYAYVHRTNFNQKRDLLLENANITNELDLPADKYQFFRLLSLIYSGTRCHSVDSVMRSEKFMQCISDGESVLEWERDEAKFEPDQLADSVANTSKHIFSQDSIDLRDSEVMRPSRDDTIVNVIHFDRLNHSVKAPVFSEDDIELKQFDNLPTQRPHSVVFNTFKESSQSAGSITSTVQQNIQSHYQSLYHNTGTNIWNIHYNKTLRTLKDSQSLAKDQGDLIGDITSFNSKEGKESLRQNIMNHTVNVIYIREERSGYLSPSLYILSDYYKYLVHFCKTILSLEIYSNTITLFEAMDIIMHIMLIVQLVYYTTNSLRNEYWIDFGHFLNSYFIVEMIIRIIAIGTRKYFRNVTFVFLSVVNVVAFVASIAVGNRVDTTSADYLTLVLFQCIRLLLMLWIERGDDRLRHMVLTTSRIIFLLFSFIYVFAILGQSIFCGAVPGTDDDTGTARMLMTSWNYIDVLWRRLSDFVWLAIGMNGGDLMGQAGRRLGTTYADDDSGLWTTFHSILSFDDYLKTMFTLFQVTVLGSWSFIMDGVANASPNEGGTKFFFYLFKLSMALLLLPVLMSFIVRSFIALMDEAQLRNERRKLEKKSSRVAIREESPTATPTRTDSISSDASISTSTTAAEQAISWTTKCLNEMVLLLYNTDEDEFNSLVSITDPSTASSPLWYRVITASRLDSEAKKRLYFTKYRITVDKYKPSVSFVSIWDTTGVASDLDDPKYMSILNQFRLVENLRSDMNYISFMLSEEIRRQSSSQ